MGQSGSNRYETCIQQFSSLDKRIHLEYQIIKGKLNVDEVN